MIRSIVVGRWSSVIIVDECGQPESGILRFPGQNCAYSGIVIKLEIHFSLLAKFEKQKSKSVGPTGGSQIVDEQHVDLSRSIVS